MDFVSGLPVHESDLLFGLCLLETDDVLMAHVVLVDMSDSGLETYELHLVFELKV